jgi:putative membrane protein
MASIVQTLALRPYAFAFLALFLGLALRDLGPRRTALFTVWAFAVAWAAEFASTRIGIPFGLYHYTGTTRGQELFLSNVPVFDSLSFVFLTYAAWCLARLALGRPTGLAVSAVGGVVMTLLDLVIDPLAVQGERWFLGRIFYYPDGGAFFGVPLSNFAGWLGVGWLTLGGFAVTVRRGRLGSPAGGAALYYGVLAFNLAVAWWIGERKLLGIGILLHVSLLVLLGGCYARRRVRGDRRAFSAGSEAVLD